MLKLFLDDTGTHKGSPVVGAGGLIGSEAAWAEFDTAWRSVLAEPFEGGAPIQKWSSFDCRWALNEFAGFSEAQRDRATYRFREVITKSRLLSAANMVDNAAWDEIISAEGSDKIATAEATALFRVITRLVPWASTQDDGPDIAVYYDGGRANNPEIKTLVSLLNNPESALPHILGVTFLTVADATPLQGADMIATESFWHAQDFLKDRTAAKPRPHFAAYLKDNFDKGNGEILDRAAIQKSKMTILSGAEHWRWNR